MSKQKVIIFGGGPSGLAAGLELIKNSFDVTIYEANNRVGGISQTVKYKDYYFDIGGHRFFTKIDEVNKLWHEIMPTDFLKRPRLSRIFYNNKFFYYPLKPFNALFNVGFLNTFAIIFSYLYARLRHYLGIDKESKSFEEWVTKRFGKRLFTIFFKTYTEKVWGIPTTEIGAEWAAQRIKGLSLSGAIKEAFFPSKEKLTTLIDEFEYPKYGVGMMYDKMAEKFQELGGKLYLNSRVKSMEIDDQKIKKVVIDTKDGELNDEADKYISSVPITNLVNMVNPEPNKEIVEAAQSLRYRAFVSICLILDTEETFKDNWIYIHSPEVEVCRIQNFKNWSPYMVPDKSKTTLGFEYICFEDDKIWSMSEEELIELGKEELEKIKIGTREQVVDGFAIKMKHVYPVYHIGYKDYLDKILNYLSRFENMQTIGRSGIFRYDNMDHAIMTGIYAARNLMGEKHNILKINTEKEYHEVAKN